MANGTTPCFLTTLKRETDRLFRAEPLGQKCLDAFRKDVAALCAFDVARTAGLWRQENPWAASAWHKRELEPHAARLLDAEHQFVTAFLGIGDGARDWTVKKELGEGVRGWLKTRMQPTTLPQWKVREDPFASIPEVGSAHVALF